MDGITKISWVVWLVLTVISLIYLITASKTFHVLGKIEDGFDNVKDSDEKTQVVNNLRGARAACVLSMIAVIAYSGYELMYIIKGWASNGALSGIMYGILMTASLYSSAFMLLSGVVLQANDNLIENSEDAYNESGWVRANRAAFAFAYVLTAAYASLFIFHIFQGVHSASNPAAVPTQPSLYLSHKETDSTVL